MSSNFKQENSCLSVKWLLHNSYIELICRIIIGFIFIYASIHKIAEPALFAKIIYGYALFPGSMINIIAIVLPYVEIIIGISLVLGIYPRSAAIVLSCMLFVFMTAISVNLIRGHEFDCGCFSFRNSGMQQSAVSLLIRDIIYFSMCIFLLMYKGSRSGCLRLIERVKLKESNPASNIK